MGQSNLACDLIYDTGLNGSLVAVQFSEQALLNSKFFNISSIDLPIFNPTIVSVKDFIDFFNKIFSFITVEQGVYLLEDFIFFSSLSLQIREVLIPLSVLIPLLSGSIIPTSLDTSLGKHQRVHPVDLTHPAGIVQAIPIQDVIFEALFQPSPLRSRPLYSFSSSLGIIDLIRSLILPLN